MTTRPMAEVSTASGVVAKALAGVFSSVGESSLGRLVTGIDATAHNLIEGVVSPTTIKAVKSRGYKYRNNGATGTVSVLTPQQLQVAKTSLDPRIMKIQRDAVNLLTRACQTSDAIGRQHPKFDDCGAAHLRLTLPVPPTATIGGFEHREFGGPGQPRPSGDETADQSNFAACDMTAETHGDGGESSVGDESSSAAGSLRRTDSSFVSGDRDERTGGGVGLDSDSDGDIPLLDLCSFDDALDAEDEPFADVPLGMLGNALKARAHLEKATGTFRSTQVTMDCAFCKWVDMGRAKGFLAKVAHVANPCGAKDLYVLDVTVPTTVLTKCMEVADSLAGEDKPAKNLHMQKVQRKLRKAVSGSVDQAVYNYLETVSHLVVMAMLLDAGDSGKNHCDILGYSGNQPDFQDFFASQGLEQAMDELSAAKDEAGHSHETMVYSVPAPQITGTLNETLVLYETAALGEYELKEKKVVVGAVHVGVDLLGKPSPNDHTNPLNFIGAVYRHFGDSDTPVAEGTPDEYIIHLDRSQRAQLTEAHDRVWEDLIEDHCSDFERLLESDDQRFDFDFLTDGKPNSYSTQDYEKWLEEQMSDEAFFSADNALCELLANTRATADHIQRLRGSAACKKGEDSARARAVITPGVAGSEGLHQARTSPIVKALEALHAVLYNHTNLKGLTEDTKRIRFAEFLRAVPKGAVVFGTDKSKNDACFRDSVWKKCVKYLAVMNDLFEEHIVTRGYVYSPDEHLRSEAFPKGSLDLKYWTLKLTPMLAILLSGIGPTSFLNRLESTVENGVAVLEVFGEEAYLKWRKAERHASPSGHPEWRKYPLPHVAEFVEWAPLSPHMVDDTSVKCDALEESAIHSHHMGIYEGDDQLHAVILPKTEEWSSLSTREAIVKYTAVLSASTGFIFEPALTTDNFDMVGHNAVCEMLSAWIGLPSGKADNYEVAVIVPKVLKAIRKLPHCTLSSEHTVVRDEEGVPLDVVRDDKFWALALTKYYALAIMNKESLGVRGLFLAHGDYCYAQLERLIGRNAARSHATIYGDRDPERRQLEEAVSTTFQVCGEMRESAHEQLSSVRRDRVVRVCCAAWRSELPALANTPKEEVCAALFAFDSHTMSLQITEAQVADPMMLWTDLEDIGCLLDPLVRHATAQHSKVTSMFRSEMLRADAQQTVQLARIYASGKTPDSALKDGRSDSAAKPRSNGKGKSSSKGDSKAKGKGGGQTEPDGKGKANAKSDGKASQAEPKGKGKAKAKTQGKGKSNPPQGKGKLPQPSWSRSTTGDSWWRTGAR